jgi:lipopolysaccharide export system protein LptA
LYRMFMRHFTNKLTLVIFNLHAILMFSGSIHAQTTPDPSASIPLIITSKTMTVNNKQNMAVFDHDVVIKKGDLTITSEHMEILSGNDHSSALPGSAFDSESVSKLRAWGNVKMHEGTRKAQAHEAIYNQKEDTVTLIGEPILFEENYQVTGTKMTFYIKDKRSIIEGSKVLIHKQEPNNRSKK